MTISIGTSAPSSARETHAAWLRLRADCRQVFEHVREHGAATGLADDRLAVLDSRDGATRSTS
jgi:hypothetical protein